MNEHFYNEKNGNVNDLRTVNGKHIFSTENILFVEINNESDWEVATKDDFIYIIRGTKNQIFAGTTIIFS